MKDWVDTNLGEVSSDISYGYTQSASQQMIGPKFLRITDIQHDFIDWNSVPYCKISEADHSKYKLSVGDVVIARTGNSTGAAAVIKDEIEAVFASYLIRFKLKMNVADYKFIDFLLRSSKWENFVRSIKGGSAQDGANAKQFAKFQILLPPLPEQKAIAAILSCLDDKIELLNKQNKTLEKIAQTLFKRWFVEFEFPDKDGKPYKSNGGKMVESELGEIPEGWKVKRADELIDFDPREKFSKEFSYKFFDMKCLLANSMVVDEGIIRKVSSGSSFRNNDTLMAKITPCLENGKTGFVFNLESDEIARGSTEFIVMRGKKRTSPYFVYHLARSIHFRDVAIKSMTGTSGRQRVQIDYLKEFKLAISYNVMSTFDEIGNRLFDKTNNNKLQIQTLTSLRDTLLPKLMSGKIRVKF